MVVQYDGAKDGDVLWGGDVIYGDMVMVRW